MTSDPISVPSAIVDLQSARRRRPFGRAIQVVRFTGGRAISNDQIVVRVLFTLLAALCALVIIAGLTRTTTENIAVKVRPLGELMIGGREPGQPFLSRGLEPKFTDLVVADGGWYVLHKGRAMVTNGSAIPGASAGASGKGGKGGKAKTLERKEDMPEEFDEMFTVQLRTPATVALVYSVLKPKAVNWECHSGSIDGWYCRGNGSMAIVPAVRNARIEFFSQKNNQLQSMGFVQL
jgi:hypothetical protein